MLNTVDATIIFKPNPTGNILINGVKWDVFKKIIRLCDNDSDMCIFSGDDENSKHMYNSECDENNVWAYCCNNGVIEWNLSGEMFLDDIDVDGVEINTDLVGSVWAEGTLTELDFDIGTGSLPFYGRTKDLKVYDKALTDEELIVRINECLEKFPNISRSKLLDNINSSYDRISGLEQAGKVILPQKRKVFCHRNF